ncbi:cytidylate kinase family protein [Candidatus Woesearchaeota archaeon]|nr:cytidylate kinase family protein [Candidatus Woesearchaeota archaeon]
MIITISGNPGSGKSTVGKLLAKNLGYKYYSIGDLMGKFAAEQGITIEELQERRKTNLKWDREIDNYQRQLGIEEDGFVLDSRLGWYFIPQSFKVFLDVDEKVGAERVFKNQRPDEKKYESVNKLLNAQKQRIKADAEQWKKLYRINFLDHKNYAIIIDTTKLTAEDIVYKIIEALALKSEKERKYY